MAIQTTIEVLYYGLMPYVANRNKQNYKDEFNSRKTHNQKFALQFFPKYINFDKWIKQPKQPYDILLLNYWIIEVPVKGVTYSKLIGNYQRENNGRINKRIKAEEKKRNQRER
ncbi:hypothetical protein [Winogradskyella eximia]|uniref:hypothetical protein n=1 Tax=Winogradskyella eximia TaxID=262006 RepID=UPI002491D272|nr:hypothetical protein [Winogradskyella eximia]